MERPHPVQELADADRLPRPRQVAQPQQLGQRQAVGHAARHAVRERRRETGIDQPRPQPRLRRRAAGEQGRGGEGEEGLGAHRAKASDSRRDPQRTAPDAPLKGERDHA